MHFICRLAGLLNKYAARDYDLSDVKIRSFEAISYVWGSRFDTDTIEIDRTSLYRSHCGGDDASNTVSVEESSHVD